MAVHDSGFLRAKRASLAAILGGGCLLIVSYVFCRRILLFSGAACFFGAAVWFLLTRPQLSARWLGLRPFYIVSRLSYGMYLNHLLVLWLPMNLGLRLPMGHIPGLHCTLITVLLTILSVGVSCVSYCLIESPFLRLRDRILEAPAHRPVGACQPV
jgi:peptidoglycan/LPS O-acetylase OafA/YrhL